jgi:hypothetical protein
MDCWHQRIERSGTEAEVVEGARDFLFLWSPRELEPLTLGWRDMRIESAEDVVRMKQWLIEDADMTPQPLRELGEYMWHAATRISELRGA